MGTSKETSNLLPTASEPCLCEAALADNQPSSEGMCRNRNSCGICPFKGKACECENYGCLLCTRANCNDHASEYCTCCDCGCIFDRQCLSTQYCTCCTAEKEAPLEPCEHKWPSSYVVLDFGRYGIATRVCDLCGLMQQTDPETRVWHDVKKEEAI